MAKMDAGTRTALWDQFLTYTSTLERVDFSFVWICVHKLAFSDGLRPLTARSRACPHPSQC